jgi:hypothetical protein
MCIALHTGCQVEALEQRLSAKTEELQSKQVALGKARTQLLDLKAEAERAKQGVELAEKSFGERERLLNCRSCHFIRPAACHGTATRPALFVVSMYPVGSAQHDIPCARGPQLLPAPGLRRSSAKPTH